MALDTATISFDLSDFAGSDFDARRTKVWAEPNVVDKSILGPGGELHLGDGLGTIAADGTGTIEVVIPTTGSNPATWQTYIRFDYARRSDRKRVKRTFGPYTVTAAADLDDLVAEQDAPVNLTSAMLTQMQALLDAQTVISGIDDTDSAVAGLIEDDLVGPLTNAALSAATDARALLPSSGDRSRQGRDVGLKAWTAALADTATVTRVLIEGHSVVTGTGASAPATSFARLVEDGILDVDPAAVVTIDGHAGDTAGEILAYGVPGVITANDHHLVVLMCLLNDYLDQVNPATTTSNLQGIVDGYTTGQTPAALSFLIVAEWTRSDVASPTYTWAQYVAAAQSVADDNADVTVLDLSQRMGPVATDTLGLYDDAAHPSDIGHRRVADLVLAELLATIPEPKAYPYHTPIPATLPPLAQSGWTGLTRDTDNVLLRYSDAAVNNSITYGFVGESGHYTIGLDHRQQANGGRYDLYIDGVLQGSGATWEGYYGGGGNQIAYSEVAAFEIVGNGHHTLQFKMATKDAASSDYAGVIRGVYLTRTGD